MAWTSVGGVGSTGNATANSTSIAVTLTGVAGSGSNVNDLLVAVVAVDNASSVSNADEGAVLSVADSGSNSWTKAREITVGGGAVQGGAVCSVWYSQTKTALTTSNTVTVTMGSSAQRDAKAMRVWRFTPSPGNTVRVADSTYLTAAAAQPGVMDLTSPVAGQEYLRFRAIASETTLTTALTTSAGWTSIGTARASATGAMSYRGEWIISSATTLNSTGQYSAVPDHASIMVLFEESGPMGQTVL